MGLVHSRADIMRQETQELANCNIWNIGLLRHLHPEHQRNAGTALHPGFNSLRALPTACAISRCLRIAHSQSLSYLKELTLKSICPPLYVPRFFLVFSCRKSFPRTYTPLQDQPGSSRTHMNACHIEECVNGSSMTAEAHEPWTPHQAIFISLSPIINLVKARRRQQPLTPFKSNFGNSSTHPVKMLYTKREMQR